MVLEVAIINVLPDQESAFAEAYAKARETLVTTPGCQSARMTRGIESPSRFVLIVEWDSVDAHIENFRASDRFTTWRGLIGPYFDGAPTVEHFEDLDV
jgi:heme-degrading monooxygenase HmoA